MNRCEIYDEPGQTCLTAGSEVINAEGLCDSCSVQTCVYCGAKITLLDSPRGYPDMWCVDPVGGIGTGVCPKTEGGEWPHSPVEEKDDEFDTDEFNCVAHPAYLIKDCPYKHTHADDAYGILTEADVRMIETALTAPTDDTDYSEFYDEE